MLNKGNHVLEVFGAEKCCDGSSSWSFKVNNCLEQDFTTKNLNRPNKCLAPHNTTNETLPETNHTWDDGETTETKNTTGTNGTDIWDDGEDTETHANSTNTTNTTTTPNTTATEELIETTMFVKTCRFGKTLTKKHFEEFEKLIKEDPG